MSKKYIHAYRYIPNITNALFEMASNLADYMDNETDRPRNPKRQRSQLQLNILDGIRKGKISKNSLSECLTTGVNKYDDEQLQMSNTANMKNSGSSNSTASNNSSWLSLLQNPSYNENIEARSSVLDRPAMELVKNAPFLPVCTTEDGVVRQDHQVPSVFVKIFE